ncbi:MAG TPA: winged helix-turn-helix domain-containing protein [Rhizomicrobium sp.]|nr:winged helix-turn-helix domain-containing protein [Rhizomicrobium sp.]
MTAETDRPDAKTAIDLARVEDFDLGASRVSPSTREVLRGSDREMLEPRVMQVLVALFQANGRVVSRDELIFRCWEGRIVGEDAINRAIGRLRRLSEADNQASFEIETIPRVGYRLLAAEVGSQAPEAVAPAPQMDAPAPPGLETASPSIPSPARQNPLLRYRLTIASMAVLIVAAVAAWLLWPEAKWSVSSSRPFISSLALEDDPAFSPKGDALAYISGPDGGQHKIFVRYLTGGDAIKVTSDDFDDASPSWSSDGGHIAYVGSKPGEPCHLMVATVPAGAVREVGRCARAQDSYVAWQPGTSFLYFAEQGALSGDSILRLDLDSGARVPIVQMPRLNQRIDGLRCSPDGKWLAYYLMTGIVIRDLATGAQKTLSPIAPRGAHQGQLAWTPDSRAILSSISNGNGSQIIAIPIDGSPSYQVYATAMPTGSVAAGGNALAMVTDISRVNLARLAATATAQPDVVEAASGSTWSPSFAPDGTLAFISNRTGANVVWIQKPGNAATQLFDSESAPPSRVRFSPDGTRLAVVSASLINVTIRIITLDGANLESYTMPSEALGLPSWTPDGKALLTFNGKDKRTWRIAADDPAKRSPFAPPHWVGVAVRPEGVFATRVDKPGIWRIDGKPSLVTGKYPAYYSPPMAFLGGDVLVPEYPRAATPRLLAQPLSGGPDRLVGYMPGAAMKDRTFASEVAVNPKTGDIVYMAAVAHDTNIDLLTLVKR